MYEVPSLTWLCMPASGEDASSPFFLFLSCFGFFFSLLLRHLTLRHGDLQTFDG